MGNQLATMASWHQRATSRAAYGWASGGDGGAAARHPDRLVAVSSRCVFDEEADVELLDTTSGSGGRVVARAAGCAGPSYPHNPPMRAPLGLVLIATKGGLFRVVDPVAGAVSVLPAEPDHGGKTHAASLSVLGRAASTVGEEEEEGEYKVLSITKDRDLVLCKVLTVGTSVGGGGGDVGAWREAEKPPCNVRCDEPWAAAVVDGVVYVLAFHRREKSDWIAAFDLATEQWRPGLLQGPPTSGAVSGLTEAGDRLGAVYFDDTSASVRQWNLMSCGDGEPAIWQEVCAVPMPLIRRTGHDHEVFAEHVWVLSGGRFAFVVWSPVVEQDDLHGSGAVGGGSGERGCQDWVLRVYDQRTKVIEDAARLLNPTDVAIGVCTWSLLG